MLKNGANSTLKRPLLKRPVHIPQQEQVIKWKWFQYMPNKAVEFYRKFIDHM